MFRGNCQHGDVVPECSSTDKEQEQQVKRSRENGFVFSTEDFRSKISWKRCHIGAKRQSPKPIQSRRKPCGALSNNKAVGQAMPIISFNGVVIERMSSLRIHFDRMLRYKTQGRVNETQVQERIGPC